MGDSAITALASTPPGLRRFRSSGRRYPASVHCRRFERSRTTAHELLSQRQGFVSDGIEGRAIDSRPRLCKRRTGTEGAAATGQRSARPLRARLVSVAPCEIQWPPPLRVLLMPQRHITSTSSRAAPAASCDRGAGQQHGRNRRIRSRGSAAEAGQRTKTSACQPDRAPARPRSALADDSAI